MHTLVFSLNRRGDRSHILPAVICTQACLASWTMDLLPFLIVKGTFDDYIKQNHDICVPGNLQSSMSAKVIDSGKINWVTLTLT